MTGTGDGALHMRNPSWLRASQEWASWTCTLLWVVVDVGWWSAGANGAHGACFTPSNIGLTQGSGAPPAWRPPSPCLHPLQFTRVASACRRGVQQMQMCPAWALSASRPAQQPMKRAGAYTCCGRLPEGRTPVPLWWPIPLLPCSLPPRVFQMKPGPCQRLQRIASAMGCPTALQRQLRTVLPLLAHAAGLVAEVGQHVGAHQRPAVPSSSRELTEVALAVLGAPVSTCRATCLSPSSARLEGTVGLQAAQQPMCCWTLRQVSQRCGRATLLSLWQRSMHRVWPNQVPWNRPELNHLAPEGVLCEPLKRLFCQELKLQHAL